MISSGIAIVQRNPFELTILLALVLLCCSCQGSGIRSSEASPWPSLSAEDPVVRIQTIHTIQSSLDRRNVPFLFPLLNDPDRWVRFNARSAILVLAGDHRQTAPPYDYLAAPQVRRKSVQAYRQWWNQTFLIPAS